MRRSGENALRARQLQPGIAPQLRNRRPTPRRAHVVGLGFVIALVAISSRARADDEADRHVPLPESIFTETVTDIDSREAGEIELEGNGSIFRARRGGVYEITYARKNRLMWARTKRSACSPNARVPVTA